MKETLTIAQHLNARPDAAWALATLVDVAGSSYRRAGARLLIGADGTRLGSVSGGCLEADVVERARTVIVSGVADVVTYDTTSENDLVWGVGLGCHGIVRVLIERMAPAPRWAQALATNCEQRQPTGLAVVWQAPDSAGLPLGTRLDNGALPANNGVSIFRETILPPRPLLICGAGDDAQPLARLAKELGWHVTVADPRPAFATTDRFPEADAVVATPTNRIASLAADDPRAAAVIMTHHYVHDLPLLRALLPRDLAYLGLLGPKKRGDRLLAELEKEGLVITGEMRARLHAPIGLDLGGDTPEAVALAMMAEMQSILNGRDGRPLRERSRPIHAD